jgi:hypothetical protein
VIIACLLASFFPFPYKFIWDRACQWRLLKILAGIHPFQGSCPPLLQFWLSRLSNVILSSRTLPARTTPLLYSSNPTQTNPVLEPHDYVSKGNNDDHQNFLFSSKFSFLISQHSSLAFQNLPVRTVSGLSRPTTSSYSGVNQRLSRNLRHDNAPTHLQEAFIARTIDRSMTR